LGSGRFLKADFFFKQSASYGLKRRHGATGCYSRIPLETVIYFTQKVDGFAGYGGGVCNESGEPFEGEAANLGEGPVLMASSDSKYFLKFGLSFVKSAFDAGVRNIHLHVVDPDEESFILLRRIQAEVGDITFTYQETASLKFSPDKSFYACSRFLILPSLLDFYNRSMVVVDIDVAVVRDFNQKIDKLHCYDVGLRFSGIPVPWLNVTGACVYVSGSQASIDFCSFTSYYISLMYDTMWGRDNWVLDQNALFSSYEALSSGMFGENTLVADLSSRHNKLVTPAQHLKGGKEAFSSPSQI